MAYACIGIIQKREYICKQITEGSDYVASHCYFCKNCYKCKMMRGFKLEMESKGFKTFNLDKEWWSIGWRKDNEGNFIPVLKYHDPIKITFN